jgi:hypothetical protein
LCTRFRCRLHDNKTQEEHQTLQVMEFSASKGRPAQATCSRDWKLLHSLLHERVSPTVSCFLLCPRSVELNVYMYSAQLGGRQQELTSEKSGTNTCCRTQTRNTSFVSQKNSRVVNFWYDTFIRPAVQPFLVSWFRLYLYLCMYN